MSERYASYQQLKFDYPHPRVLRITLSNPERANSMTAIMHAEVARVWRDVDDDPGISAVIVTGEGKWFSPGGDMDLIDDVIDDFDTRARAWKEAKDIVYNMINCSKPIVSAIRGPAFGAGLACALMADISIASRTAQLMDGHSVLGVAAGDHAVMIWPLLCGMAKTKYHVLLCEPVSGEEAERIGLVSQAVDDGELDARAVAVAVRLASGPPNALRWTKYALNNWLRAAGPTFDASLALEMLGFGSPDVQEGIRAMREKRAPNFVQTSVL
jgi:enoyl-CoA hydratase